LNSPEAPQYRRVLRVLLAVVGVLFLAIAILPLREDDLTGALTFVALGIVCLGAARTGRDPLNPDGSARSFRVSRVTDDIDRLRREDEGRD